MWPFVTLCGSGGGSVGVGDSGGDSGGDGDGVGGSGRGVGSGGDVGGGISFHFYDNFDVDSGAIPMLTKTLGDREWNCHKFTPGARAPGGIFGARARILACTTARISGPR